ncbi:molybdopterin-containing oxidoreductase family protein [Heliorestis acidaminivorans]|nr:molybdopterin-dependent oxidoreductase [Heliorestis acidaminivorans]
MQASNKEGQQKVLSACPLRCYDLCSFQVHLENGQISALEGNAEHMVTKGFLCSRAEKLLERHNSIDRITSPLLKKEGRWQKCSWEEAMAILAESLDKALVKSGPASILHIPNYASTGLLKKLDRRFFNALGAVTRLSDNSAYSVGISAQKEDFGSSQSPAWADLVRSRTIIIWGRQVANTNIHLLPYLMEAKEKGAQIIAIDPLLPASQEIIDQHIAIRPGTDGLLALSMAQVILAERWWDSEFIAQHVEGFEAYVGAIAELTPEKVASTVGIESKTIYELARRYARSGRTSAIIVGAGLQKYQHSGHTVRAMHSLAMLTGQIGLPGGGVHLATEQAGFMGRELTGEGTADLAHYVHGANLASEILLRNQKNKAEEASVPLEVAIVAGANPVNQLADSNSFLEAWHSVPFKVVIDFYLTDTASSADLVLPAATSFEADDLYYSPWNDYVHYQSAIVKPRGQVRAEYSIWQELAQRLQSKASALQQDQAFWAQGPEDWFKQVAIQSGLNLEALKKAPALNPYRQIRPYQDRKFSTPSGKARLLPEQDILRLVQACQMVKGKSKKKQYQLLTLHCQGRHNSQLWFEDKEMDESNNNDLWLSPEEARTADLRPGDDILVETDQGNHLFSLRVDEKVPEGLAVVYQGLPHREGGGINKLTKALATDLGQSIAYHQNFCEIKKVPRAEMIR